MNASTLNKILLTIAAKFELWLLGSLVATLGAIVAWWATSSLAPLSVVALVVAFVSSAVLYVKCKGLAESAQFLAKLTYPPVPVTLMIEFWLVFTETVWDALGLTPDERAIVKARPTGSIAFVIEQWGKSFTRWRVQERESGRIFEKTIDCHGRSGYDIVPVWEVELGPEIGAASVELAWRNWGGEKVLTFAAFGGRFGGWVGPIGDTKPSPEHTLFRIPIPLDIPKGGTMAKQEFDGSMARYRVRGEQAGVAAGDDAKRLGCDVYFCDELTGKGFRWCLVRRDCRPKFTAIVLGVQHAAAEEVGALFVRLFQEPRWELSASLAAVEPDDAGRTAPQMGDFVLVAFGDNLQEVERIWLLGTHKTDEQ